MTLTVGVKSSVSALRFACTGATHLAMSVFRLSYAASRSALTNHIFAINGIITRIVNQVVTTRIRGGDEGGGAQGSASGHSSTSFLVGFTRRKEQLRLIWDTRAEMADAAIYDRLVVTIAASGRG